MASGTVTDASILDGLTAIGKLGSGANSTVLEVEDRDGARRALKVTSHFWVADSISMLDYERQILSGLPQPQHPGVVRLLAEFIAPIPEAFEEHLDGEMREQCVRWAGEHDGERPRTQFYLLEKFSQTLHEWSAGLPLPLPYPLLHRLSCDIVGAVAYLTEHRVVHLDCKSDNVLVADDGRAVLSDFGIARQTPTDSLELELADPSELLLNRLVLAPEVLTAHEEGTTLAAAAAARADSDDDGSGDDPAPVCVLPLAGQGVWAAAVCLMETAVGWSPFPRYPEPGDGVEPGHAGFGVTYDRAAATVVGLPPVYPAPFRRLLRAMLSADPALRPTPAQALEALAAARPSPGPTRLVHAAPPNVAVRRAHTGRHGRTPSNDTDAPPSSAATDPVTVTFCNVFGEREVARVVRLEPVSVALLRTSPKFRRLPPRAAGGAGLALGSTAAASASFLEHDDASVADSAGEGRALPPALPEAPGLPQGAPAPAAEFAASARRRSASTGAISGAASAWKRGRAANAPMTVREDEEEADVTDSSPEQAAARAIEAAAGPVPAASLGEGAQPRGASGPPWHASLGASKSARSLASPTHREAQDASSPSGTAETPPSAGRGPIISLPGAQPAPEQAGAAPGEGLAAVAAPASAGGASSLFLRLAGEAGGLLQPPGWRAMVPLAHAMGDSALPASGLDWAPPQWDGATGAPSDGSGADGVSLRGPFSGGGMATFDRGPVAGAAGTAAPAEAAPPLVGSLSGQQRPPSRGDEEAPPSAVSSSEWVAPVARPVLLHGGRALGGSEPVRDLLRLERRPASDGSGSPLGSEGSPRPSDADVPSAVAARPPALGPALSAGSRPSVDDADAVTVWVLPPAADALAMSLDFAAAVYARSSTYAEASTPEAEAEGSDATPSPRTAASWAGSAGVAQLSEDIDDEAADWRVRLRAVQALALTVARAYSVDGAASVVDVPSLVSLAASFASAHSDHAHVLPLAISTMRNCSCLTGRPDAERMASLSAVHWAAYALGVEPSQSQLADDAVQLCANLLRFDEVLSGPDADLDQLGGLLVGVMEHHRDTASLLEPALALAERAASNSEGALALARAGVLHAADVILYEQRRDRDRVSAVVRLASTVLAVEAVRSLDEPFSAPDMVTRCLSLMHRDAFRCDAHVLNLCILVVRNAACVSSREERAAVASSAAAHMGVVRLDEAMERFPDDADVAENGRCAMFNLLIAAETRAALLEEAGGRDIPEAGAGGDDDEDEGRASRGSSPAASLDAAAAVSESGTEGETHGPRAKGTAGLVSSGEDPAAGAEGEDDDGAPPQEPTSPGAPLPGGYASALAAVRRLSMVEAQQRALGPRRPAAAEAAASGAPPAALSDGQGGATEPGGSVAITVRAGATTAQRPPSPSLEGAGEADTLRRELRIVRIAAHRRMLALWVLGALLLAATAAAIVGFAT